MRAPRSSLLGIAWLLAATASCSLAVDVSGYSGGQTDAANDGSTLVTDDSSPGDDGASDATSTTSDSAPADDGGADSTTTADATSTDARPSDASTSDSAASDATATDAASDALPPDATASDSSASDSAASDAAATDTGSVTDTGGATDTGGVTDSGPIDSGPCGTVTSVGVSEVMIRANSGLNDNREWMEITNYDTSCTVDLKGMKVEVYQTGVSVARASYTFGSSFLLAPGAAVVLADDKTVFLADTTGLDATRVFDFGVTGGDVFINGNSSEMRLYAPGSATPYEVAVTPKYVYPAEWPQGQSFAFPVPGGRCPASSRLSSGNMLTPPWQNSPNSGTDQYGSIVGTSPVKHLYGTPTAPNSQVACGL